jgi:hypothetical protein
MEILRSFLTLSRQQNMIELQRSEMLWDQQFMIAARLKLA